MSATPRPEVVRFAPGSGEIPPPLGPVLTDPQTELLLVVAADDDGAAVRTAVELADARAQQGHATVLVDAGFRRPSLHKHLEIPNLEGIADIFEFGASLSRVTTRPEDRAFDFIPTGPYVPDAEAILRSGRWDRIGGELATESRVMLVFVPADLPGLDSLSQRAGKAILVGAPDAMDRAAAALDPSCEVVAVVEPTAGVPASAAAGPDASVYDPPELTEPLVFREESEPRQVAPLLWVVLVVVLAAAGWLVYRQLVPPAPAQTETPVEAAEGQPEPEPVETPIGYSVAVEAHQDLDIAQERAAQLRQAASGVQFYIAPVPISGSVWHRVLAGPVAGQEAGIALQRWLVDEGHKSDFDSWAVRPTAYAYYLGEFDTRAEADRVVAALAQRDFPAYVVTIRYEPGEPRYRIYAGAFETETTAEVMEEMMAEIGIEAPLIERVGEPITLGS